MTRLANTGQKNITYREDLDDYFVQILRNRKKFGQAFNTLEEAIAVRDQVLEFYDEFRRIPSSKELGLKRREHRREDGRLRERYISLEKKYRKNPYRLSMTKHGVYFVKNFATLEEAIETRDKLLQFFKEFDRLPNREEQKVLFDIKFKSRRNRSDLKNAKSNTGLMNITFNRSFDRYQIQIARQQQRFSAVSRSLEEAIKIRDEALKFYEDHGRLPSTAECFASIKKGTNL